MGMPGQHQIHPRRLLGLVVMGLVVQDNTEFIRIQPCRQLFHSRPGPPHLILRAILPSDQIETIIQQHSLILQHNHIVFLKLRNQIPAAVTTVCVISLVMVPEDIIDAICGLKCAQCPAGGNHVLLRGIVVHIVPCDYHNIRIFRLHILHPSGKAFTAEGITYMRIRKLHDAQGSHVFVRLHRIGLSPYMIGQKPSAGQIHRGDGDCSSSRIIP